MNKSSANIYNFPKDEELEEIEVMVCTNRYGGHMCNVNTIDCFKESRTIRVWRANC